MGSNTSGQVSNTSGQGPWKMQNSQAGRLTIPSKSCSIRSCSSSAAALFSSAKSSHAAFCLSYHNSSWGRVCTHKEVLDCRHLVGSLTETSNIKQTSLTNTILHWLGFILVVILTLGSNLRSNPSVGSFHSLAKQAVPLLSKTSQLHLHSVRHGPLLMPFEDFN